MVPPVIVLELKAYYVGGDVASLMYISLTFSPVNVILSPGKVKYHYHYSLLLLVSLNTPSTYAQQVTLDGSGRLVTTITCQFS